MTERPKNNYLLSLSVSQPKAKTKSELVGAPIILPVTLIPKNVTFLLRHMKNETGPCSHRQCWPPLESLFLKHRLEEER